MANNKQDKQTRRNEAKAKRRNKSACSASSSILNNALRTQQAKQVVAPGVAPPKLSAAKSLARQQMKLKQKELRANLVNRNRGMSNMPSNLTKTKMSLESLVGQAASASTSFAEAEQERQATAEANEFVKEIDLNDNSRKAYMRELKKVVDRADVILEILDARDPMGCRTIDMEDLMRTKGKKVVLVLNKIDLVPPEVLQPWLAYLRTFYPTIAFKASTQDQKTISSSSGGGKGEKTNGKIIAGSRAVGTEPLMQLLKNYCRSNNIKTSITVGVIGYPNVGKSSVINSLKRSKAASVSSTAGHTKVIQEIHLDNKVKLIDCPGIVFDTHDQDALILRNCVNAESLNDPVPAIEVILKRCSKAQLQSLYGVPPFNDTIEFLVHLAQKLGKLGKGGIPDRKAVARSILQDWNRGKIPFFTPPPAAKDTRLDVGATIVSSFGDDFDLAALNPTVEHLQDEDDNEDENDMDVGPVCSVTLSQKNAESKGRAASIYDGLDSDDDDSDNDDDESDDETSMQTGGVVRPKFKEDALNIPTALIARRRAKALRKQKRKAAAHQISAAVEDEFCDILDNIDMSG
ncbi:hypothetical protein H310_13715 [Aphanomyces invadans]|uniref:CP-type G domain-containing protein n=1 Tax=Aphanomyces invadans TaxID=157072 RepID=A0A024TD19_9STRA|nr:hypothetical protein H310_13715 [Aphanomyces invadans]ETV91928.1 hypothetical protein H310_13715 [Aphanomyces invadans]|eukprot:XP_008879565.1 hypothetical protein H310_13715 [Aphanomyces invadans]